MRGNIAAKFIVIFIINDKRTCGKFFNHRSIIVSNSGIIYTPCFTLMGWVEMEAILINYDSAAVFERHKDFLIRAEANCLAIRPNANKLPDGINEMQERWRRDAANVHGLVNLSIQP